jgi:tetratricopeptide (TPR) repeat protein
VTDRRRETIAAWTLIAATLLAYLPALGAGFIWDDDDYVTENRTLEDVGGLRRIWLEVGAVPQYYPLVHTSFWIEHRLWGKHPTGYHVVNVLLHGLNGVLLWRVLRRLAVPGAWVAAAVFVLHPVHVESVAWVTERKNVLSGCFYLLALLAWLRTLDAPADRARAGRRFALVAFVGALLSKTVTASLPAVMLLVLWWKRGRIGREGGITAPMFALGAAAGLLTAWMERSVVGAVGEAWSLSLAERVLVAGRALWFYVGKLAWPEPLIFVYPRWNLDTGAPWQWLIVVAAAALGAALWLARGRIGRGPCVAAAFFALTLAPALGFLNVYPMRFSFVADHFQYLASIGPIALAVGVAASRAGRRPAAARAAIALAAVVLLALGARTALQTRMYEDEETLWRATVRLNPEAHIAHNNLGGLLLARAAAEPDRAAGLLDEAERHVRRAAGIDYPEAHNNLGIVLHQRGEIDAAIASYREALQSRPAFADAENNLGISLAALGRLDEATRFFALAVQHDPGLANARFNLGTVLLVEGRLEEALLELEAAARLDPDDAATRDRLAEVEARLGEAGRPGS